MTDGKVRITDGGGFLVTDTSDFTVSGGEFKLKENSMPENRSTLEPSLTRAEVQAMIDAATATDKARLWNINCLIAGREDLQVSAGDFADDAFKVAFVTAVGAEGMQALGAPLTIGETPKAPWS